MMRFWRSTRLLSQQLRRGTPPLRGPALSTLAPDGVASVPHDESSGPSRAMLDARFRERKATRLLSPYLHRVAHADADPVTRQRMRESNPRGKKCPGCGARFQSVQQRYPGYVSDVVLKNIYDVDDGKVPPTPVTPHKDLAEQEEPKLPAKVVEAIQELASRQASSSIEPGGARSGRKSRKDARWPSSSTATLLGGGRRPSAQPILLPDTFAAPQAETRPVVLDAVSADDAGIDAPPRSLERDRLDEDHHHGEAEEPQVPEIPLKVTGDPHSRKRHAKDVCRRCKSIATGKGITPLAVDVASFEKSLEFIRHRNALVALVLDATDIPGSIPPNLSKLIGKLPVVVAINKVDLLPAGMTLDRAHEWIRRELARTDVVNLNVLSYVVFSARTMMNVERLAEVLAANRGIRDIYMVGCSNAGKSSTVNALLRLAKSGIAHRATTGIIPGTTVNLLSIPLRSFGILFEPRRGHVRGPRSVHSLQPSSSSKRGESRNAHESTSRPGRVDSARGDAAIAAKAAHPRVDVRSVSSSLSKEDYELFEEEEEVPGETASVDADGKGFDPWRERDDAKADDTVPWRVGGIGFLYDTPGCYNPSQILTYLQPEELAVSTPDAPLRPRVFSIMPGMSLFVGGVARIEYKEPSYWPAVWSWQAEEERAKLQRHLAQMPTIELLALKHQLGADGKGVGGVNDSFGQMESAGADRPSGSDGTASDIDSTISWLVERMHSLKMKPLSSGAVFHPGCFPSSPLDDPDFRGYYNHLKSTHTILLAGFFARNVTLSVKDLVSSEFALLTAGSSTHSPMMYSHARRAPELHNGAPEEGQPDGVAAINDPAAGEKVPTRLVPAASFPMKLEYRMNKHRKHIATHEIAISGLGWVSVARAAKGLDSLQASIRVHLPDLGEDMPDLSTPEGVKLSKMRAVERDPMLPAAIASRGFSAKPGRIYTRPSDCTGAEKRAARERLEKELQTLEKSTLAISRSQIKSSPRTR